jgi:hypothetical protein
MPKGIYVRTKRKAYNKPTKAIKATTTLKPLARTISIKEASEVLSYLVRDIKDLDISFFHTSSKVNIGWGDELFQADTLELPKVIESIKFLQSKEMTYSD